MAVAATLEVEASVLVETPATPSPPVGVTAWAGAPAWEAPASPPLAAGAQRAVAPASSLFPPRHPAGGTTGTEWPAGSLPGHCPEASLHL